MTQQFPKETISEPQKDLTIATLHASTNGKLPAISYPHSVPPPTPLDDTPVATLLATLNENISSTGKKTVQHRRALDYAHRMAAKLLALHGAQHHKYLYFGRCVEVYAEAVKVCEARARVVARSKKALRIVIANLREREDAGAGDGERKIVVQRAKDIVDMVKSSQGSWERKMMEVLGQLDRKGLEASTTNALND
ncbi:hypothetical protein K505DRAFT_385502 [Melanomma pulvis-pyrius CBS 109.77]|uniref:Uncharacterized protein n=1 Tax=Melanomma pulvis-pyrius CBS 109.77 TaxID=1314802 RepID=A0A6A6XAU3_9PLEO|nr:hypothetical protein K505DRAFT_385502 [Melanomma pulvis-pyrius CBS 109.77]